MILDQIRRNFSSIVLYTLVFLSIFWARAFAGLPLEELGFECSIFTSVPEWIGNNLNLRLILSMLVTLMLGLGLYQLNTNHMFMRGREHLLAPFYVISLGAFSFLQSFAGVHIAAVFILLSINSLFSCYRNEYNLYGVFSTFMYIGIATLFYAYSILLIIPAFTGLLRFKSIQPRDIIIMIAGLLCPCYFASFVSYFLVGQFMLPVHKTIENLAFEFTPGFIGLTLFQYTFALCAIIFIAVETFRYMGVTRRGMTQKAVSCNVIFSRYFIFCALAVFIFAPHGKGIVIFASIPGSVMLSNFFASLKHRFWSNFLFLLLLATAIISCYISI
ncbi:MAG: hypothetical protein LBC98_08540 [Prevotellaceae bacterium]|jgi:hypothetical protein|nr:hypothetical protein [Prevotellaceae bacterium]